MTDPVRDRDLWVLIAALLHVVRTAENVVPPAPQAPDAVVATHAAARAAAAYARREMDAAAAPTDVVAGSLRAYAADTTAAAARAAADAARAAMRAGPYAAGVTAEVTRAAGEADEAALAANRAAQAAGEAGAVRTMTRAANAATRALLAAAGVLARMTALDESKGPKSERGKVPAARPLGRVTARLVGLAVVMLPAAHRVRYRAEWRSLLFELGTRRARARHVLSILCGVPAQRRALRPPEKLRSPDKLIGMPGVAGPYLRPPLSLTIMRLVSAHSARSRGRGEGLR
jgi:hypothetical protein